MLGVVAGALLTAVIQSSSASVGILQALCLTGAVPFSAAIPIIMGQNIGTCITAILSAIGAKKNAKRAAIVHLYFNIVGTDISGGTFANEKNGKLDNKEYTGEQIVITKDDLGTLTIGGKAVSPTLYELVNGTNTNVEDGGYGNR